jgi:hypothetical protein
MPITLDGTNGITTPSYGGADTAEYLVPVTQFKNRIINGAMMIDQRNAGASVTITDTGALTYTLDRWFGYGSAASKFSIQQNAGSVTPPAGFSNYLGVTSASAYSVTSGDLFFIGQAIEGFNTADLNWGTANAKTVTLSFWVRSSLTGTFGASVQNSASSRSYPFSFTISSANTWEQKSVTIAGDTTGTWVGATNGIGLRLFVSLGMGSTYSGTAGAWVGSDIRSATGATSVVGTNGATFYITGVQLEVGSTATSFDYRPYGTELQLCQRYFQMLVSGTGQSIGNFAAYSTTYANGIIDLHQTMRVTPTLYQVASTSYFIAYSAGSGRFFDSLTLQASSKDTVALYNTSGTIAGAAGDAVWFSTDNAAVRVGFQAEL